MSSTASADASLTADAAATHAFCLGGNEDRMSQLSPGQPFPPFHYQVELILWAQNPVGAVM
eukprot:10968163-Prorocentrum_lima.AAC.1